jgi:hypothetical protein
VQEPKKPRKSVFEKIAETNTDKNLLKKAKQKTADF